MKKNDFVPLHILTFIVVAATALILSGCRTNPTDTTLASDARRAFGTIDSVSAANADSPALVALGRHLYFSKVLSENRTQSCNTCHPVDNGRAGVDNEPTSIGAHGMRGRRNSPTVLNAGYQFAQFWDGRAATLEEQAAGPIVNPVEMAMPDPVTVEARLRNDPAIHRELFRGAFGGDPDPYTIDNAARAIAAFERTLRTHDRFDEFQTGNVRALTASEKEGLQRFMALGCTSCHNGPLAGGQQFQRIGLVNPYPTADRGRSEVTKDPSDDYQFKVPSLRNVALTAPYFHDGSITTLPTAVERMAWHQLGMRIEPADRDAIVAFLRSLSDRGRS